MKDTAQRVESNSTRRDWYWMLGRIGQILIATGVLLFLFVGYQLWGTGIEESQAQSRLQDRFEETLSSDGASDPDAPPDAAASVLTVNPGDPIAVIRIPRIGVEKYVVEGVDPDDLKKGPGHYPGSVQPGRLGNFAVAGHRTTYGEPFRELDRLDVGDDIEILDAKGRRFVYVVTEVKIVQPNDSWVVATTDPDIAVLTLTTCHPEFSARQRLVVSARLDDSRTPPAVDDAYSISGTPVSPTTSSVEPSVTITEPPNVVDESTVVETFDAGWFYDSGAWIDLLPWLIGEFGIVWLALRYSRRFGRGRRLGVLTIAAIPAFVVLYFVFQNVSRLLPPNL